MGAERQSELSNQSTLRWAQIIQQTSLCGRHLRRLVAESTSPWNLGDTEFLLLFSCELAVPDGIGQHLLAHSLGVSPAQMSGMVYDLRDRGLVSLERPQRDRRRQLVRITGQGRLMLSRGLEALGPLSSRLDQDLTVEEQQLLHQLLGRLIATTDAGPTSTGDPSESSLRRAS